MSYYSTYRWCAVPECKNTSVKKPNKLWIQVPKDLNMRKTWFKLARRDPKSLSERTRMYFCEDHFDLEHDMENYMQYKTMGSVKRIRMKLHCIPSRFDWNRKHKFASNESHLAEAERLRISISKDSVQDQVEDNVKASSSCIEGPESVPGREAEMEDEVPKVCRACLASGVRMFDVAADGLKDTFERVTGAELYTSDERPRQVCFVCCSQLQRFRAFCQMSRKAETYLTKLLKKGLQVTEQEVSKRHHSIKPKLNVTKNPLIAIHTLEDSNECASVEVKNEEQDNNIRDSETESETEIGSEIKTRTHISERENEREESLPDLKTEREIKIEIDEIDIEEFDPLEAVKHTTVRDEACYCLQCAEAFPSQSELLKHVQFHTQKKLKQANSTRRNVKAKIIKRNVKTKLESQCKFCNMTFAIKTQLVTHVATEHDGHWQNCVKPDAHAIKQEVEIEHDGHWQNCVKPDEDAIKQEVEIEHDGHWQNCVKPDADAIKQEVEIEHGIGELSEAQKPKRRKLKLKKHGKQ